LNFYLLTSNFCALASITEALGLTEFQDV
jgi:hypothetical protein